MAVEVVFGEDPGWVLSEAGHRCILYTDLGNPTSNAVYRGIGYRAVAEGLRYPFAYDARAPVMSPFPDDRASEQV